MARKLMPLDPGARTHSTGFQSFRGKGLGRWLKPAMLERVRRERPEARFIRTGNADSNTAMLGIKPGAALSRPYLSRCVWQLETEKALAYVTGREDG